MPEGVDFPFPSLLFHEGRTYGQPEVGRYHFLLGKTLPAGNQSRIRQKGENGSWRFFIIQ